MPVYEDADLERLLERARKGDGEAWGRLVDRFQALVYSTARRYGLGVDDAADVFQTTFQSLYRTLDRIDSGRALPRWLSVTAGRESLRVRRLRDRTTDFDAMGLQLDEIVAAEESDAESVAVEMERALILHEGLAQIAERCRELLGMLYLREVPYQEISDRLAMPVGTIGPTRARCLEKLRVVLGKRGFFG